MISHRAYLGLLGALFGALWVALALDPLHRDDWMLENVLVAAFVVAVAASHRKFLLSRTSCTLIFLFLCLHEVGADLRIGDVPLDGDGLAAERLDFGDRLVRGAVARKATVGAGVVVDDDVGALPGEFDGNAAADAAGTAGDDCALALEQHPSPPLHQPARHPGSSDGR